MTEDEKCRHGDACRQRLSVLRLAETLNNVSKACSQRRVSRTQFYEYKRRFKTHGMEGLKDLPPIYRSLFHHIPPKPVDRPKARSFVATDPHEVHILLQRLADLPRRVYSLGISIHEHLEHHARMIAARFTPLILLQDRLQI